MILFIINHPFRYETENLCRVFVSGEDLKIENEYYDTERYVLTKAVHYGARVELICQIQMNGKILTEQKAFESVECFEKDGEYQIAVSLYRMFSSLTGYTPKWGILTGVRPSKLMRRLIGEKGKDGANSCFKNDFFVNDEKIKLCLDVTETQDKIISTADRKGFSLYISIPFCPSRCLYCSFVSHSIERTHKLIPQYVKLLCEEIKITAEYANRLGLKLQSVYFGGGTPTTLDADMLELLMKTIAENFDMSNLVEYTVEAGRPDTITEEKLLAIKANGADRISINTQTTNDEVLSLIGRKHTADDYFSAMRLAKRLGIESINTDIIAGLPGDSLESFKKTVDEVLREAPESVTVHTLSVKRSSYLNKLNIPHSSEVNEMLDFSYKRLMKNGQYPYYMYRQSNMASNLENVGYCKAGHEGVYNVFMMEEIQTVLSCGAGAVTKLKVFSEDKLERVFNFKFPYEYIDRFDEIIDRKNKITEFYKKYY